MSRLIDELNKVARAASQPIGFRTARTASSEPRLLLIASLTLGDTELTADYVDGADAVLLHMAKSRPTAQTVQAAVESLPDIPWGIYQEDAGTGRVAPLIQAGCDFVVFPAVSPVTTTPQNDKVGKVLQVESSLDDGLLRAVNDLPVDAALVTDAFEGGGSLVWHQLMIFQHLTNLLTKPVIVPVSLKAAESELKVLWEAGVDGIVVEADAIKPGGLKELHRLISQLPARTSQKRGKAEALLPYPGGVKETEPEEEEEE